ncbi:hypothetical protein CSV80_12860 [Sporosarcina sp. P12(2017)]|uniref:hypothetical protein n=1 Tax=unclassified Sporosarcina TaxID=2647733 RepID=UPI000C16A9D5|nr:MULTISPECIES: hypothetical protein [unclassified Sporosarcina]PIC56208.1 hypothetical protein CSV81_15415 [Sporosarcina sp. P10]PIC60121.1 hypothetical protein CSV80_12860 [Sporosarcina sp. P12(2017)]
MNNKWRIIFTSLTASIMLAACGTSDADPEKDTTGNAIEEPAAPETNAEENTSSENEAEIETDTEVEASEDVMKDAVETTSDEQDYSMMVLPGYTLTSEEPGRDSLYLEEDSEMFMRIETMPKDEESYTFDELYENMGELLMASSDGETPIEITDETDLPQADDIKSVKGAVVDSTEGYFTGYVIEREDKLIRVTIYAKEDNEHMEEFKDMAATIK